MANITISFPHAINVSVQVGDMAYYTSNTSTLGTHTHSNYGDIIQIGEVLIIDRVNNTITCDWAPKPIGSAFPSVNDFIMFSKDNKVNLSGLLGYYYNNCQTKSNDHYLKQIYREKSFEEKSFEETLVYYLDQDNTKHSIKLNNKK